MFLGRDTRHAAAIESLFIKPFRPSSGMDPPLETLAEPLDLADVRSYLSMDSDDTSCDPILAEALAFCRDRLESVLPYYLAEREITRSIRISRSAGRFSVLLKGPVVEIIQVSVVFPGYSEDVEPSGWFCFEEELSIEDVPSDAVGVVVRYHAGAHVPPRVKNVLLMMVRNRYERRDEDPLTEAVMSAIYMETRPNI